jgi:hypothetical protein
MRFSFRAFRRTSPGFKSGASLSPVTSSGSGPGIWVMSERGSGTPERGGTASWNSPEGRTRPIRPFGRCQYSGGLRIGREYYSSSDPRFGLHVSRAGGRVRNRVRPLVRNMGLPCPRLGWVPRSRGPQIGVGTSCRPHVGAPPDCIALRSRIPAGVHDIARDDPGRQISLEPIVRSDGQYE